MFTEAVLKEIEEIKKRHPDSRSALLPALYIAQKEFGWLSREAMQCVAHAIDVPEAAVKGTASFYAMFKHNPMGRHLIQLCTNVSCMISGSEKMADFLKSKYGLESGGISKDNRFSLIIMECIGSCGTGPAMLVDTDFHENLTEEKIEAILNTYE